MKINSIKISYSTTIPIMSYGVNDKIGVELELLADAEQFNLEEIISEHKANVDAIVKKLYPSFYQNNSEWKTFYGTEYIKPNDVLETKEVHQHQPTHEEIRIGDIENDIRSCKDLKVLETYRFIAKSKPEFQKTYDEVYAKLSNKK